VADVLRKGGWNLITVDLRATGIYSVKGDQIGRAPDHNSAEWAMWTGRPLLGQWTYDVVRVLDVLGDQKPVVIGDGPAGLVALSVSALAGERTGGVVAMNTMASYITHVPYENQRLGTLTPGILRDVGDVAHLAAIGRAPRTVIVGGVNGKGQSLDFLELTTTYAPAVQKGRLVGEPSRIVLLEWSDSAGMLKALE
ncbi:MAG: acetylxylan esterase, partial [Planctomycetaceae bacterium]|nr:acetylxylan esterase [Planctomycetaceae bacterium]